MDPAHRRAGRRTRARSLDRGRTMGPHAVRGRVCVRGRPRPGDSRQPRGAFRHRRTHHLGQQPRARDRRRRGGNPRSAGRPDPPLRLGGTHRDPAGNRGWSGEGPRSAAKRRRGAGGHAPDLRDCREARTHRSPHHGGVGADSASTSRSRRPASCRSASGSAPPWAQRIESENSPPFATTREAALAAVAAPTAERGPSLRGRLCEADGGRGAVRAHGRPPCPLRRRSRRIRIHGDGVRRIWPTR